MHEIFKIDNVEDDIPINSASLTLAFLTLKITENWALEVLPITVPEVKFFGQYGIKNVFSRIFVISSQIHNSLFSFEFSWETDGQC